MYKKLLPYILCLYIALYVCTFSKEIGFFLSLIYVGRNKLCAYAGVSVHFEYKLFHLKACLFTYYV